MNKLPLLVIAVAMFSIFFGCKSDAEKQLEQKEKELNDLRELAEVSRREMENEYAQFAAQYSEMKKGVRDDSLLHRLDVEQRRADSLLKELKKLKTNSAAEILRLKRELETVRAVLRDYVRQVDSLQRLNAELMGERDSARAEVERTRQVNTAIREENEQLSEQVNIAAQLNATGIALHPLKKNGKAAKRTKDVARFCVSFSISRNVTAAAGNRMVYVRLMKPNGSLAAPSGKFHYQDRDIDFSAAKSVEYNGEETQVIVYVPVDKETLVAGTYTAHIFTDGQMIGVGEVSIKK
jgi:myosin heavy subunit